MYQEERCRAVIKKWLENKARSHMIIAKDLKMPQRSVDIIIARYSETLTTTRKSGTGSNNKKPNQDMAKKILDTIKNNRSLSLNNIAKLSGTCKQTVMRTKLRHGFKSYKKTKVPKVSLKQQSTIKTRAKKLWSHIRSNNFELVLDNKTYVKADFLALAGPQYYTKTKAETLPKSETTISIEKFGKKFLIWQAISSSGERSSIYITEDKTINKTI